MITAYIRVSTDKQTLDNQQNEIENFAASRDWCVDRWVREVVSGRTNSSDRKVGALIKRLGKGDILIVTELSRLSRSLTEIMSIVGTLLQNGVHLYSTKDRFAFDDTINSKVLCFAFGLVAEIERNLISMRTKEALSLRKARGVELGRPKGSSAKMDALVINASEIVKQLNSGLSVTSICRKYGVSRTTFYKFRNEYAEQASYNGHYKFRKKIPAKR